MLIGRFVNFTYGGETVSKRDQTQFPDGGEQPVKNTKLIFHRKQKRPNQILVLVLVLVFYLQRRLRRRRG